MENKNKKSGIQYTIFNLIKTAEFKRVKILYQTWPYTIGKTMVFWYLY